MSIFINLFKSSMCLGLYGSDDIQWWSVSLQLMTTAASTL